MVKRPNGALLAGVCADISAKFGWNVWVLRGLFVLGLLIKTLATGAIYLVLALVFTGLRHGDKTSEGLSAPEQARKLWPAVSLYVVPPVYCLCCLLSWLLCQWVSCPLAVRVFVSLFPVD
jgi:phage shock protein PspC (stress-responsive transcriptional regulator)